MKIKMLYLSCHSILEWYEVSLFAELGIEVFALGSYLDPHNPVDPLRPPILNIQPNKDLIKIAPLREKLTKEFVDYFDVIYIMHIPQWISANWEVIKNKIVIWRSIGQSVQDREKEIKPYRESIKIVRYSPSEKTIPGYIGEDAMIRFYTDPEEFNNWNGQTQQLITIGQDMQARGTACNYELFERTTRGLNRKLYGKGSEKALPELVGGKISFERLKQILRDSRCYFYTGTHPASYTLNFIEALMTGIPLVCLGPRYGNAYYYNLNTYEIPDIIQNGYNGFWSDDEKELRTYCEKLLSSPDFAKEIGQRGRETAIKYFGKENIKAQWKDFFAKLS